MQKHSVEERKDNEMVTLDVLNLLHEARRTRETADRMSPYGSSDSKIEKKTLFQGGLWPGVASSPPRDSQCQLPELRGQSDKEEVQEAGI